MSERFESTGQSVKDYSCIYQHSQLVSDYIRALLRIRLLNFFSGSLYSRASSSIFFQRGMRLIALVLVQLVSKQ